jgi:hypothetical protein
MIGCVSRYNEPEQGGSQAVATFRKGYDVHFPEGGMQTYGISEHDDCTEAKMVAVFGPLIGGDAKTVRIIASHPAVIFAYSSISVGTAAPYPFTGMKTATCKRKFRFLAQEGHSYDIKQDSSIDGLCAMSVTDTTTGAAVASLPIARTEACTRPDVWE